MTNNRTVLLFFKDFERDKFFRNDRYLKRLVRPVYNLFHSRQKQTGFAVSFSLLCRALRQQNYNVRVNNFRAARRNPGYPVGIVGYPAILDHWTLPNPALLGPGLYDHPMLAPDLMNDPRFRRYVVLAPWTREMYFPVYGDACFQWFAGINLDEWPDVTAQPKQFNFLVYDKVRWARAEYTLSLTAPILAELDRRGLTYTVLRYGDHDRRAYRRALGAAQAMIFLCEHETQGLAYQRQWLPGCRSLHGIEDSGQTHFGSVFMLHLRQLLRFPSFHPRAAKNSKVLMTFPLPSHPFVSGIQVTGRASL